jgi:hypothetical protein
MAERILPPAPPDAAILIPFDRAESITVAEAAKRLGRSQSSIKRLAYMYGLGRPIAKRWLISWPALLAFIEGDIEGLQAYWVGDRSSPLIASLYERAGVPLPRPRGGHPL